MSNVAGLFAGIGGMEIGFQRAGFHASMLSEIDDAAVTVLRSRFPVAQITGDVTQLERLPKDTTVVTAGFPCQDLSAPGGKAGIGGLRSGLVSHVFRLIASAPSVEWLVLENVPYMLSLDRGQAMAHIVDELEAMSWRWAYRTVDAICVLPQRRRRVLLVASPRHDPSSVLFGNDFPTVDDKGFHPGEAVGFYWTEGRAGSGFRREAVPTLKVGSGLGILSAPAILTGDGALGMPSLNDAERLQGFEPDWTLPAGDGRGVRWRLVGNAVPPPLAEWVARNIANPPGMATAARLSPMKVRNRWPGAAFGDGRTRQTIEIGETFVPASRPMLTDYVRDPLISLSKRAVDGFLGRARRGGVRWPVGFLDAVSAHA